jgi:hypothetical protein
MGINAVYNDASHKKRFLYKANGIRMGMKAFFKKKPIMLLTTKTSKTQ